MPLTPDYDPGSELVPDWDDIPESDEREPDGDPHQQEGEL